MSLALLESISTIPSSDITITPHPPRHPSFPTRSLSPTLLFFFLDSRTFLLLLTISLFFPPPPPPPFLCLFLFCSSSHCMLRLLVMIQLASWMFYFHALFSPLFFDKDIGQNYVSFVPFQSDELSIPFLCLLVPCICLFTSHFYLPTGALFDYSFISSTFPC